MHIYIYIYIYIMYVHIYVFFSLTNINSLSHFFDNSLLFSSNSIDVIFNHDVLLSFSQVVAV